MGWVEIKFVFFFFALMEICKVEGVTVNSRIDALNATIVSLQWQISSLSAALAEAKNKELSDVEYLTSVTNGLSNDIYYLSNRVSAAETDISNIRNTITVLDESLLNSWVKIGHLEEVDQIWKRNFRVVNRTFAELRKKFKIQKTGTVAQPVG